MALVPPGPRRAAVPEALGADLVMRPGQRGRQLDEQLSRACQGRSELTWPTVPHHDDHCGQAGALDDQRYRVRGDLEDGAEDQALVPPGLKEPLVPEDLEAGPVCMDPGSGSSWKGAPCRAGPWRSWSSGWQGTA